MALSIEEYLALADRLNRTFPTPKCESCGSSDWGLHNKLYHLTEYTGKSVFVGGAAIPLVVLQCAKCGTLRLLNAIAAGAVGLPPGTNPETDHSVKVEGAGNG
jgi:hypothetical protein